MNKNENIGDPYKTARDLGTFFAKYWAVGCLYEFSPDGGPTREELDQVLISVFSPRQEMKKVA